MVEAEISGHWKRITILCPVCLLLRFVCCSKELYIIKILLFMTQTGNKR